MSARSFFGYSREEQEAGLEAEIDRELEKIRDAEWEKYNARRPRGDVSARTAFNAGFASGQRAPRY